MFSQSNITAAGSDKFHNLCFASENGWYKDDKSQSMASGHCVPFLQATLFACILEDCLTQMRILAECQNELRILKTKTEIGRLRALKFHVKQEENTEHLDKINHKDLGSNQYKINKLFSDRKFFSDVLQRAYLDMALDSCFSGLTANIKTIEDRDVYRVKLAEEESNNKIARRELTKQLRQQRNHIKSAVYDTNLAVDKIRCAVEDTELNSEIRSRFVENWQLARTEQNNQDIFYKELGPSDAINYFQTRSDQEQRVHSEVELLVNIFIDETLTYVENWMDKFDKDMEAQDLNIAKIKNKLTDAKLKKVELEEMYATHAVLTKNWLQFKADRLAAIKYREKMTKSALIVQAWWRGLLVRLQKGPYKPTKTKVAPADKKKKKKK